MYSSYKCSRSFPRTAENVDNDCKSCCWSATNDETLMKWPLQYCRIELIASLDSAQPHKSREPGRIFEWSKTTLSEQHQEGRRQLQGAAQDGHAKRNLYPVIANPKKTEPIEAVGIDWRMARSRPWCCLCGSSRRQLQWTIRWQGWSSRALCNLPLQEAGTQRVCETMWEKP